MQNNYNIEDGEEEKKFAESIDWSKLLVVIRKSLPWVLLIMLATNAASYLYLRYTKPVYQSSSIIKLDIKSEASVLGLGFNPTQNLDNLSGEIELLRSNLFFSKVIDVIDFEVSYYAYGRVLDNERYENSPFRVEYKLLNEKFYDQSIDVEILNDEQFVLAYIDNGEVHSRAYYFGERIKTNDFEFTIFLTDFYNSTANNTKYYFTINSDRALIGYLQSNMEVEPVNFNAKTIKVGFKGYDRKKVRDLVMAIDSVYLDYTREKKNQATDQKIEFLDEQLVVTEQRLEKFENYFENFTITNKTTSVQSEIGKAIQLMNEVDQHKFDLQTMLSAVRNLRQQVIDEDTTALKYSETDLLKMQAQANASDTLLLAESPIIGEIPTELQVYINNLNQELIERDQLLLSYKTASMALQTRNQRIANLKQEVIDLLAGYDKKLKVEIDKLEAKKTEIEENFVKLPSKSTEFGKNERFYSLYENLYLSLIEKKNELEIAKAGTVTDFVILAPANYPSAPVSPEKITVHGIGVAAGIVLSFLFIAVGYLLNNTISSQQELERYTQVPILGTIPYYRKVNPVDVKLVVNQSPKSAISEAFRSVRTNMQFMGARGERNVISVTSTIGSEGKTFFATNLGNVMALSNQKVVVLDVDLRKPKVHHVFSQDNSIKGISTILIGEYEVEECIVPTEVDGLDFIPAGPIPPNPSELIISKRFDELLDCLKNKYDIVIIDTPPVGLVTDGMLVMEKADLPVYVMRSDYSRKMFVKTVNQLEKKNRFKSLSIILNAVSYSSDRSYGYGKYSFGYYEESVEKENLLDKFKGLISKDRS